MTPFCFYAKTQANNAGKKAKKNQSDTRKTLKTIKMKIFAVGMNYLAHNKELHGA